MSVYLQRDDILDALQKRAEEFYSCFTPLKRVGHELVGPCPLHGGRGPNFKVSADTGAWYCHSQCGRGGDVFTFLEIAQGLHYGAALKHLADWTNLPAYSPSPAPPSPAPPSPAPPPPVSGGVARHEPGWVPPGAKLAVYSQPLPPPQHLPDPDCVRRDHAKLMADPERLEWLRVHRGVTQDTLTRFQIGMTYATGSDLDVDLKHPRITFPIYDRTDVLINVRKHLFAWEAPDTLDRQKLGKTLPHGPGLPAGLFPQSVVQGEDGKAAGHLLLVEGEPDALLANQLGFPAVSGTGGAGGWSPRGTRELEGVGRITILYDADEAGRKGAKARAKDLSGTIPDVRIAELPAGLGKDLTEWIVEGGGTAEALRLVIQNAVPHGHPAPLSSPFLTSSSPRFGGSTRAAGEGGRKPIKARVIDLADVQPPPAELPYLWGPYLNEGASHWLTGRTGLGKSTFAFNLACALAEGLTLWGVPSKPRRLLYVDMESGDLGRSLKIQRLFKEREKEREGLRGRLLFVREPLRLPDESAELIAYAAEHRFDLIVFDTARRVFSVRDENDNAEVYNRIVPTLDALKNLNIATLTMGHPPKNGGLGARGAGAQEDAGDINLLLTMHSGEVTDPAGVISLSITKNRLLGLGQPPLFLRRVGGDRFEAVDAGNLPPADADPEVEKVSTRVRCRAVIIEVLESSDGKPIAFKDVACFAETQGFPKTTCHRVLREMVDGGEIIQPASGQYALDDPFS